MSGVCFGHHRNVANEPRSKFKAGSHVIGSESGKIQEQFFKARVRSKLREHEFNRNTGSANDWLPRQYSRVLHDAISIVWHCVVHNVSLLHNIDE
jgi:hypothetical protein